MKPPTQLKKSLSLGPAIGLAITMVVGSGLLVLPGLAYAQVGAAALYAWFICALAVGPILIIFSNLGARFPNAGGVAGFLRAVLGPAAGTAAELLVLGALPGGAAIAITGGQYFAAFGDGSPVSIMLGTGFVVGLGGLVNFLGGRLSGKLQQILALILVLLLVLVALAAIFLGERSGSVAPLPQWSNALPAFGLVFFAFVGWELMAFTSEEFENPRRDFPWMMGISYGIVVILYALTASTLQFMFQPNDPLLVQAPMAAMLSKVMGPFSGKFVAALGFFLVLANFISVVWAFSRLVFASAREGLLPGALAQLQGLRAVPARAITAVTAVFGLFVCAYFLNLISHSLLFELAGVSFFFSYLLAVLVYLKLARTLFHKTLGAAALCLTLGLFAAFGQKAFYALALFAIGWGLGKIQQIKTGGRKAGN